MTNNKKRTKAWRKFGIQLKGSTPKREKGFTYDFDAIETAMLLNGKDRSIREALI